MIDSTQKFEVIGLTRPEIADELNDCLLDAHQLEPNDPRLTIALCQRYAAFQRELYLMHKDEEDFMAEMYEECKAILTIMGMGSFVLQD